MDRPYVVCHILTSLNGKIDGDFFAAQATAPAQKAYGSLETFLSVKQRFMAQPQCWEAIRMEACRP